jgi:purine-binding chemotaxis protein CheW
VAVVRPEVGFLTFRVGSSWFALSVRDVQEILRDGPITTVPGTSPLLRGVLNLRGQVAPVLDLARMLDLETSDKAPAGCVAIVRSGPILAGILVDRTGDVLAIEESDRHSPRGQVPEAIEPLARFITPLPDFVLCGLDLDRILAQAHDGAVLSEFAVGH